MASSAPALPALVTLPTSLTATSPSSAAALTAMPKIAPQGLVRMSAAEARRPEHCRGVTPPERERTVALGSPP